MESSELPVENLPRYLVCYGVIFLFFLLDIQVLSIFLDLSIHAVFMLPAIYYWAIYRPTFLPPWFLFLIGFIKDLLTGLPFVGLSSAMFIAVYSLISSQRTFLAGQSFLMLWAGYLFVASSMTFVFWLALCAYLKTWTDITPFALETGLMILAFPVILPIIGILHRTLPFTTSEKTVLK